jgi:hypothetical protein
VRVVSRAQVQDTLLACTRDLTFVQLPGARFALRPKPAPSAAPPPPSPAAVAAAPPAPPVAAAPPPPPPPPQSHSPEAAPPTASGCDDDTLVPTWLVGRRMRGWWGPDDGWYAGCVARIEPGGRSFLLRYDLTNRDTKAQVSKRKHTEEEERLWPLHRNPDGGVDDDGRTGPYQLLGAPSLPAVAADKKAKPARKGGRFSYPYASVLREDASEERVRLGDWVFLCADDVDALAGGAAAAAAAYPARLLTVEADVEEKEKGGAGGVRRSGGNPTITVLRAAPLPAGAPRKFPGAPSCLLPPCARTARTRSRH